MPGKTYSISEINEIIKCVLEREEILQFIQISGEISNYKVYPSGHAYFTLKDSNSTLKAVCFKSSMLRGVHFKPENGMQIIALGRIAVYERDGVYQLYVERMLPAGQGDIMQLLEQMRLKLEKEGLFDPKHKQTIPTLPRAIGVITSPSGAAIRDIIKVAKARYPGIKIYLIPVRVQGLESEAEIVKALELFNRLQLVDVVILGRGGGSKEDLWVFNSEQITRKVFASRLPIISAVGHETDYTLIDYVADVRAATPSQAAELAVPDVKELSSKIELLEQLSAKYLHNKVRVASERLGHVRNTYVFRQPKAWLTNFKLHLDTRGQQVITAQQQQLFKRKLQLRDLMVRLNAANPLSVMERGFVGLEKSGKKINSVGQINVDDLLTISLLDGSIKAQVTEKTYTVAGDLEL